MCWRLDQAIEHLETAQRLSPHSRVGAPSLAVIGCCHLLARRFDQAEAKLLLAIQQDPYFTYSYSYLAACYAHMGRLFGRMLCAYGAARRSEGSLIEVANHCAELFGRGLSKEP
jgi:tetratricopeptide (TPR) repeat protein